MAVVKTSDQLTALWVSISVTDYKSEFQAVAVKKKSNLTMGNSMSSCICGSRGKQCNKLEVEEHGY